MHFQKPFQKTTTIEQFPHVDVLVVFFLMNKSNRYLFCLINIGVYNGKDNGCALETPIPKDTAANILLQLCTRFTDFSKRNTSKAPTSILDIIHNYTIRIKTGPIKKSVGSRSCPFLPQSTYQIPDPSPNSVPIALQKESRKQPPQQDSIIVSNNSTLA